MAKKATAKQLAARKKFVAMVKAKAGKKAGKTTKATPAKKQSKMPMTNKKMAKGKTVKGGKGKMPMVNGKPAWLAKKGKDNEKGKADKMGDKKHGGKKKAEKKGY